MVLRGSNIAPGSLQEAELALRRAQEKLDLAKAELDSAKESTIEVLNEDAVREMSKEQLVDTVHKLHRKVVQLEERERQAEEAMFKSMVELQKTMTSLACGGAAGAIARTTVAPLDRIKILMQTAHLKGTQDKYGSILGTMRSVIMEEGILSLWRGNLTNCVRVVPHTATQFVSYDKYKSMLLKDGEQMTVPTRLMSGALAGMTAATVTHPMDVVRIRLQTQPELKGVRDAIRSVHAENGLRSFYKGYTPAMLSLSPFIAINFAAFDTLKTWYYGESIVSQNELKKRSPVVILGLGACAGIIAQTACYPLDTVRRRMQLAGKTYSSTLNAFATIVKQEGIGGYYKGMTANALKVVPNNAIRFAAFDTLKSYFMTDEALQRVRSTFRSQRTSSHARGSATAAKIQ